MKIFVPETTHPIILIFFKNVFTSFIYNIFFNPYRQVTKK